MTKILQIPDFTGHTIYAGIDVHKKNWNITLFFEQQYLRKFQQEANPQILINHLRNNYPGAHFKLAYEAGFCGFWIQRALTKAGMECIVANAADVPQTDKDRRRKNDTTDSKRIGESLSNGSLKPIFIPDPQIESDRSLVRYRHGLHKDLVRSKERIKSLLHQHGIKIPEQFDNSNWSHPFIQWLKDLNISHPSLRLTLSRMIEQVEYLRKKMLEITRDIRALLQSERYCYNGKLLMSIPGIGALIAITILTEIGSIKRFPTFYHLNSFVGLCPTEFSSGENERKGSITPRHHAQLRSFMIEMAWTGIRLDPALTLAYNEYLKRMSGKRAIIRIARKMLNRIHYVLTKQQQYVKGVTK